MGERGGTAKKAQAPRCIAWTPPLLRCRSNPVPLEPKCHKVTNSCLVLEVENEPLKQPLTCRPFSAMAQLLQGLRSFHHSAYRAPSRLPPCLHCLSRAHFLLRRTRLGVFRLHAPCVSPPCAAHPRSGQPRLGHRAGRRPTSYYWVSVSLALTIHPKPAETGRRLAGPHYPLAGPWHKSPALRRRVRTSVHLDVFHLCILFFGASSPCFLLQPVHGLYPAASRRSLLVALPAHVVLRALGLPTALPMRKAAARVRPECWPVHPLGERGSFAGLAVGLSRPFDLDSSAAHRSCLHARSHYRPRAPVETGTVMFPNLLDECPPAPFLSLTLRLSFVGPRLSFKKPLNGGWWWVGVSVCVRACVWGWGVPLSAPTPGQTAASRSKRPPIAPAAEIHHTPHSSTALGSATHGAHLLVWVGSASYEFSLLPALHCRCGVHPRSACNRRWHLLNSSVVASIRPPPAITTQPRHRFTDARLGYGLPLVKAARRVGGLCEFR